MDSGIAGSEHQAGGVSMDGPMAPPRFTQKLKSQEVAEGSPIRLECRVIGNPQPLVRTLTDVPVALSRPQSVR
ncbi:hypothetical protein AOLI_G00029810 [Acnodon oligacanthus]